jgi:Ribosomal protein L7/L12 C-terminal domain
MDPFDAERIERLEYQVARLYRHLGLNPDEPADRLPPVWGQQPVNDAVPTGYRTPTMSHTGVPLPPSFDEALSRNKLINAIKIYRETTGVGLKEAKDAVDEMVRRNRR